MPFLDHLEELRRRLFYCAIALAVGAVIAWAIFEILPHYIPGSDPIEFLQEPIRPYLKGNKLVVTEAGEYFQVMLNVGFWIAFVLSSPVILFQLWGFVSPAMYQREKKIAIPIILSIVVLFVIGVIMAFVLILPLTLKFLLGLVNDSVAPMLSLTQYFSFMTFMCLGFGAAFELPIVIMGLTMLGLVKPEFLSKYRRYAFVACLVGATFITPDPTSMFVIAIPIYLLFELSIVLSRMVVKAKLKRDKDDDEPKSPRSGPNPDRSEPRRLGAPA